MNSRVYAVLLLLLVSAAGACTSSSTTSVTQGNSNYDSQYRQATTGGTQTYEQKQEEKKEGDTAITVMQVAMETGDVYPGEDYYVYAVVDNPTDRKNLQYVWSTTSGEVVEVPEAERGRLQVLVDEKYSSVQPAAPAAAEGAAPAPEVPLPAVGNTPPGAASIQPAEAAAPVVPPIPTPGEQPPIVDPNVGKGPSAAAAPPEGPEAPTPAGGAVKTEDARLTHNPRIYEKRIVAGPEDEAYFSADDQAEISTTAPVSAETEDTLDIVAAEQASDIRNRAQGTETRRSQSARDLRNNQRSLVTDDQRDEPEGSPNVLESGNIAGDPYDSGDLRDEAWDDDSRPTTAQLDAARGLTGSGVDRTIDYEGDFRDAERGSSELRSERRDAPDKNDETTADKAYERFSLVTDEPFIRWTPSRPGDAKLFVKVRWKTDDLTKATELPVEIRLREPTVKIADDDFPDMVREDEPLFIRIDGDNLPAFQKGLFTLSFDPDLLSFREAELGEFFDDSRGAAELFYAQPDKLSGKVILAIDSNTELTELSGGGPLLYVKFKAKRDIETREQTQLALVQDTASQYVLDGAGDNILPMAVDHPVYATALVMPPRYGPESGVDRVLTPGEETPAQKAAKEEAAKAEAAAIADGTAAAPAPAITPPATPGTTVPGTTGGSVVAPQSPPPTLSPRNPADPNIVPAK
jgi:hypothetical protein